MSNVKLRKKKQTKKNACPKCCSALASCAYAFPYLGGWSHSCQYDQGWDQGARYNRPSGDDLNHHRFHQWSWHSDLFFLLKKYQGPHHLRTQDPYLGLINLHLLKGGIKGWRWHGLHLVHKSQVIRAAMSCSSTNMRPSSLPDIWIFCLYLKTGISPNHDHVGNNFAELPLLWASSRVQ